MYELLYYWNERGDMPVKEYISLLPEKMRIKIQASFHLLSCEGPALRRPYADKIRGQIYELRVRLGSDQIRILYAFVFRKKILLLHFFRKKTKALLERDLELAENRLRNFMERYEET